MLDRVCSLLKVKPPVQGDAGLLLASGATVPTDGASGYQPGCLFQHTDGGEGTALYVNEGTVTACDFNAVSAMTAAQEALLGAVAGTATASKAVILNAASHINAVKTAALSIGTSGAETSVTATGAELNTLAGATAGTAVASKAVVLNAAGHTSAVKTAALSIGASGAEVLVTATPAQLNTLAGASAGIAAVLAGGLGGSAAIAKTLAATTTVVAAHATKARAVLVVVNVTETYDVGTGTLPTVKIGEDDTIEKAVAATVLTNQAAGTTLVYVFDNLATKKIIVTSTAAVGDSTGGCVVTALAIPTT